MVARSTKPSQDSLMAPLNRLVRIEAAFASDVQHDVSMRVLTEFLEAWKKNVEAANKKNAVSISYGQE